jgi:hypothetical protein
MKFADSRVWKPNASRRPISERQAEGRVSTAHSPPLKQLGVRIDGAIHRPEATPPLIPMQPAEWIVARRVLPQREMRSRSMIVVEIGIEGST